MKKTAYSRFIFYNFITLLLIAISVGIEPEATREFLHSFELWRDPILASSIAGWALALLGVYILLNRIVFVSLGITQGAGLGIFTAFWIGGILGWTPEKSLFPLLLGFLFAATVGLLFASLKRFKNFSEGSLIALIYIVASGFILLLGDRISQGKHEIDNLLFGNAVAITPESMYWMAAVLGIVLLLHGLFRKRFLYVSADPIFMKSQGLSIRFWMLLLYGLLTFGITASLKVLGSLPVFALIVIPPFMALRKASSVHEAFWIAGLLGCTLPALGYYFSYVFSFPTGASSIVVGVFYLLAGGLENLIFSQRIRGS